MERKRTEEPETENQWESKRLGWRWKAGLKVRGALKVQGRAQSERWADGGRLGINPTVREFGRREDETTVQS